MQSKESLDFCLIRSSNDKPSSHHTNLSPSALLRTPTSKRNSLFLEVLLSANLQLFTPEVAKIITLVPGKRKKGRKSRIKAMFKEENFSPLREGIQSLTFSRDITSPFEVHGRIMYSFRGAPERNIHTVDGLRSGFGKS
ncbi:hypothetical protein CDAR_542821 [Caerostris darwini]|uniref:Ribosomal protein S19 n=1 Tax=Caerostris darwini TaxID=1538125 RepID=A0AAV4N4F7_9ARAC|nr:hypothetical protein CDAR_542821 [Caerostris darwini]